MTVHSTSSTEAGDGDVETVQERELTDDDLALVRSHRRSYASGNDVERKEDWAQIERLVYRMFGQERRATAEEAKTRHTGVVWRNLTVKGMGLGAALQPTNGDILLGLPRLIKGLLTGGRKGAGVSKPPIRTILDDFTVSLRHAIERRSHLIH